MGYTPNEMTGTIGTTVTLLVSIFAAIAILIFMATMQGATVQSTESLVTGLKNTYTGLSLNIVVSNTSMKPLSHNWLYNGTARIYNTSKTWGDVETNFTINYNNGSIMLKKGGFLGRMANGKKYNVSYSYKNWTMQRKVELSQQNSLDTLRDVGRYMPLFAIGFVLIIVFAAMAASDLGKGGGGSAL